MIKNYLQFINENKSTEEVKINMSKQLIKKLKSINNKYSDRLLSLNKGISKSKLKSKYADYLDIADDGINVSYINNDIKTSDPYNTPKRQGVKITRLLPKLLNNKEEFLKGILQNDINLFSNEWKSKSDGDTDVKIEEYSGKKILEDFNTKDNIDKIKFGASCANFNCPNNGFPEPEEKWFDVYIQNPKQIKAIVAVEGKKLLGRRILIEGEQYVDAGDFKKGEKYSIISPYYGEGGSNSLYDNMIKNYVIKTRKNPYENRYGDVFDLKTNKRIKIDDSFIIQLDKTDFDEYPPFDSAYINNKNRLLSFNRKGNYNWVTAYKAGHGGNMRV